MLRKLLLPALAIGLLGGCVTSGYQYDRDGYYYGQPSTNYRYSDGYYDGRYRYPGSYPGSYPGYYGNFSYSRGYRYPGYGYGYGGYPNGYYRPPVIIVRPGYGGNQGHRPPSGGRDNRAPWRDYERLQRDRIQQSTPPTGNRPGGTVYRNPVPVQPRPAAAAPNRPASPPNRSERNSRSDRMIERARTSREVE